jgi:hypothetical protein
MERRHDRLATSAHEGQDAIAPLLWVQAELVLQADDIARAVVGDFGRQAPERYLRLSYASSMAELEEAMARLRQVL